MILKNKSWIFLLVSFTAVVGMAQDLTELRHCTTAAYKMDFYIFLDDKKVNHKDTLTYTWFKAQKIHQTQGASAGNLLHGAFIKYYTSGQLAQKGIFKLGLKQGEWTSWYPSGHIQSVCYYKDGLLHGKSVTFDEEGKITETVQYKKGQLKIKRLRASNRAAKQEADTNQVSTNTDKKWFKNRKEKTETTASEKDQGAEKAPKNGWLWTKKDKGEAKENETDKENGWFKQKFKRKNKETDPIENNKAKKEEKRLEKEKRRTAKIADKK